MLTTFVLVALAGLTGANPLDLQAPEGVKGDRFDLCSFLGCNIPPIVTRTLVWTVTITSTTVSSAAATSTATVTTTVDCSSSATTLETLTSDSTSTGTTAATTSSTEATASTGATSTASAALPDTTTPTTTVASTDVSTSADITTSTAIATSTDTTASTETTSADTTSPLSTPSDATSTDMVTPTETTTSTSPVIPTDTSSSHVTTSSDMSTSTGMTVIIPTDTTSTETSPPADTTTSTTAAAPDTTTAEATAPTTTSAEASSPANATTTTAPTARASSSSSSSFPSPSNDTTTPAVPASTTDTTTPASDTATHPAGSTASPTTLRTSSSATGGPSPLSTLTPLDCSANAYFIQDRTLLSVNLQTGANETLSTSLGSRNSKINAIGFNVLDNFIYGLHGEEVVRVGRDGAFQSLLRGDTAANAGDIDDDGQFYYTAGGRAWGQVDLKPGSARYGRLVARGTSDSAGLPGHLAPADWAFTPAAPGFLHSVVIDATGVVYLVRWGVRSHRWEVSYKGVPSFDMRGGAFGAVVATSDGVLYASHSGTGAILRIPLDYPEGTTRMKARGPRAGNTDGCRCAARPDVAL
ncbi:proline rich protein 5MeD [Metarhizium album ARSEF 1941]|uniref:Proline rich protein 5MeD n=1 Tax=Metarhizium album (strain ARSEF 1941) TaxID=1081103 RepID=A0A0B2X423_METAS|nr:proline rich protein 5MeD [Metarhizium album ARSEF 1941]KHO00061.1 proline rich protein 5MeD [Metarhizium album ARSEF 1941]